MVKDDALVEQLKADYTQANITLAQRTMLDYAAKLTKTPWQMVRADVEQLREHGFSDLAILDINQIVGYYAFVNRLADGLGVELEAFWEHTA